jgi:hypothetical protein
VTKQQIFYPAMMALLAPPAAVNVRHGWASGSPAPNAHFLIQPLPRLRLRQT